MRASRMNLVTLREDPSDAEIASHRLLMRGGFLHKSGAGLYLYAPLLKRVLDKASRIVAEEISRPNGPAALEVTMPIMSPTRVNKQILVSEAGMQQIVHLLENPPEPTDALRALMARTRQMRSTAPSGRP